MDSIYHAKYLKYKSKYLTLKNKKVGGGNKPTIYFFKLEGCGPCINFQPVWDELINTDLKDHVNFELHETKHNVVNKDLDNMKNKYNVQSFPSIVSKDNKEHYKELWKQWYEKNKEKINEKSRLRYQQKKLVQTENKNI
jgi:thiol-disulfide isomerase/thioredoxin